MKKPAQCRLFYFLNLKFLITIILLGFSTKSFSKVRYFNQVDKSKRVNEEVSFYFRSLDYEVNLGGGDMHFGKSAFLGFRTKSIKDLSNYVFVNFIKGCHYSSDSQDKWISKLRRSFEALIPYQYKSLAIDSSDSDPSFKSDSKGRQYYYQWNKEGKFSYDFNYVGEIEPESSFLFVRHSPGTAYLSSYSSTNISVKYKSCLFHSWDVPSHNVASEELLKKSLACFDWDYSRIYDYSKEKFISKGEIDSFCLK